MPFDVLPFDVHLRQCQVELGSKHAQPARSYERRQRHFPSKTRDL